MIDYDAFDVLTFDCYGTLIDWETGILAALRTALGGAEAYGDDELLALFAAHEHDAEVPYKRYRDVLALTATRVGAALGLEVSAEAAAAFGGSVVDWPAFPDSSAALHRLQARYRLGVITNCDDDLFAASARRLGVTFDHVTTAQQAGAYKPDHAPFHAAHAAIGTPRERILHVAQSVFHDHVPAKELGMTTVWIDRRAARGGAGATPAASATPDATFATLAAFADAVGA
jgi:2-haloacid dehalogenase